MELELLEELEHRLTTLLRPDRGFRGLAAERRNRLVGPPLVVASEEFPFDLRIAAQSLDEKEFSSPDKDTERNAIELAKRYAGGWRSQCPRKGVPQGARYLREWGGGTPLYERQVICVAVPAGFEPAFSP